jgi:hypothetical protein
LRGLEVWFGANAVTPNKTTQVNLLLHSEILTSKPYMGDFTQGGE